jgi:hypothetical protein
MRDHVERFCAEKHFDVEADGATWVLSPAPPRDWDEASARMLRGALDREAAELLLHVASASAAGRAATFGDAARHLARSAAELMQAAKRVNEAAADAHRVQVLGLADIGGEGSDLSRRPFTLADHLADVLSDEG